MGLNVAHQLKVWSVIILCRLTSIQEEGKYRKSQDTSTAHGGFDAFDGFERRV